MKSYWFYINPYTFIWINEKMGIIYNSYNYRSGLFKINKSLSNIIGRILNPNNMYCILIEDKDFEDEKITTFINIIISIKSGILIDALKVKNKPISFYPKLKLMTDILRSDQNVASTDFDRILTSATIYLNGKCTLSCVNCASIYKQCIFCTKSNLEIELVDLNNILHQLQFFNIQNINILGGNIFGHTKIKQIFKIFKSYHFKYNFFIHYLNFNKTFYTILEKKAPGDYSLTLLIDSVSNFKMPQLKIGTSIKSLKWLFIISDLNEFNIINGINDKYKMENVEIKPFYNCLNIKFFKKYVFLKKPDILNVSLKKHELFLNQILNRLNFGHLFFMPNRNVLSNINSEPIGTFSDPIIELALKEYSTNKSWMQTRLSVTPCNKCIFNNLCPPITNYELILRKHNLCNIKI